jgi:hypothetical protein
LSAGQIQLGGANGLTNAYVNAGCAGAGPCVSGSTGSLQAGTEQNYDNVLFSGATNGANTPKPYSTYSQTTAAAGTLTDAANGVTFSMINDGVANGASKNFWNLPDINTTPNAVNTMVIPVGVFGVSSVFTLIQDELATAGPKRDLSLIFNFGSTANASTVDSVLVKAVNSQNNATASGQVRNAVDCTTPPCGGVASPANGPLANSSAPATYKPTNAATALGSGVTVLTNNLYSFNYTNATGSYAGTTGAVNLDDQGFFFNNLSLAALGSGDTNLDTYLVSIEILEPGIDGVGGVGLSAITLNTSPVPEPATVLLFVAGLGAIALARFRRTA